MPVKREVGMYVGLGVGFEVTGVAGVSTGAEVGAGVVPTGAGALTGASVGESVVTGIKLGDSV